MTKVEFNAFSARQRQIERAGKDSESVKFRVHLSEFDAISFLNGMRAYEKIVSLCRLVRIYFTDFFAGMEVLVGIRSKRAVYCD